MGVPKFRGGGIVPVERPLWDKFLFRTLGSSSSFGDREGVPKVGVQKAPWGAVKYP